MEDCIICYSKQKSFKILPCQHKLCNSCFLKLDTCICPYCREKFYYTKKESIKRATMNIDYRNWHPPSQLTIPEGFTNVNRNNVNNIHITYHNTRSNILNYNITNNSAFSRINRNRTRRRRKTLTMKEIQEKRRMIKKKCKKKWERTKKRTTKINWWDIPVN
jgi:hypothetical protein